MWFQGDDLVTGINGNTFSDQAMLFGAFLMKNIFFIFPTHILNYIFCSISLKISCFFKQSWQLCASQCDYIRQNIAKVLDFLMKSCKKYSSKYELEKWWKYFSSEMHQTTLPGHWKCFHIMPVTRSHWCMWKNQVFSCLSITIGISIVNACTTSSLYRNACLLLGRGAGSRHL